MMIEPKLRFKADDGSDFPDWEEKTLGELANLFTGKSFTSELSESGRYVVMDMGSVSSDGLIIDSKLTDSNRDLLRKGDLIMPKDDIGGGLIIGKTAYIPCDKKYVCGDHVYRLRFDSGIDALFMHYEINSSRTQKRLRRKVTGSAQLGLNSKSVLYEIVSVPSFPEQRKIADLLSAVDDVIAAQEAEVAAWEKRKKGVMQKLFSQEVRFKADDGSDFPDWESSTVGELFTFVTEKNESGRIGDVITNSAEHGLIPQREYFDKDIAVEGNTEGYTVIHKGDFVYNPRKSTIAPFGPFNIYERDEVGIVSPLYTCLTPRDGETAPYLSWYFKTSRWHRYIVTHGAQGGARHDRVGMTNALMKGVPVMLPSLPEQRKIADCLTSLDDAIAKSKDELDAWRELKKGLLQQMFV